MQNNRIKFLSLIFLIMIIIVNIYFFYDLFLSGDHDLKINDVEMVKKDNNLYNYRILTEANLRNFKDFYSTYIIPRKAVFDFQGDPYIYTVDLPPGRKSATVEKQKIQVGQANEQYVEIVDGLEMKEEDCNPRVIIKGLENISPGDLVYVINYAQFMQ